MAYTACQLSAGLSLDCRDSNGGLEKVYIWTGNGGELSLTLTSGSECEVAAIAEDGVTIPTADWYEFQIPKQTSNLVETITVSSEAGTVFYEQVATLIFNKLQCAIRDQILLLAKNTQLQVIAKDNNGEYWLIGALRGAEVTAGTSESGTAYGDRSGYSLTITGREIAPMYTVDPTTVLGL